MYSRLNAQLSSFEGSHYSIRAAAFEDLANTYLLGFANPAETASDAEDR
jgi:hypothetical protein